MNNYSYYLQTSINSGLAYGQLATQNTYANLGNYVGTTSFTLGDQLTLPAGLNIQPSTWVNLPNGQSVQLDPVSGPARNNRTRQLLILCQ